MEAGEEVLVRKYATYFVGFSFLIAIFSTSCSKAPHSGLVGEWVSSSGVDTFSFRSDGTLSSSAGAKALGEWDLDASVQPHLLRFDFYGDFGGKAAFLLNLTFLSTDRVEVFGAVWIDSSGNREEDNPGSQFWSRQK